MYKRYEYFTSEGKKWTKWFEISDKANKDKWQLKNKLRNEFKDKLDD